MFRNDHRADWHPASVPTDERPEFLAVYDYGTGGVRVKVRARSPEEIAARYPQLTVFAAGERPDWMTEAGEEAYTGKMHFDLDAPEGWLAGLEASGD